MSATRGPTPERLLDVRTPTELTVSPEATRIVFALAATVSERGVSVPSDLWLTDVGGDPIPLTTGPSNDGAPAWSPDGTRLAFVSDRILAGHHLPYMMTPGGEATLVTTLRGNAEQLAWSNDGRRLLVLAADPWSYGLDWSAVAVTASEPDPDPIVRRPHDAWRRLFMIDIASGDAAEVGPPGMSVWEFDWDGEGDAIAIVSTGNSGSGWYRSTVASLDLTARSARTLYTPTWQIEGLAVSPDGSRAAVVEGYSSDHGLLGGSVMIIDIPTGAVSDPWPGLETVGLAEWIDDSSLWYSRSDSTGTACGRIGLDASREEVWAGAPFIGDEITKPACTLVGSEVFTTHQAHGLPPELARLDRAAGEWVRLTGFNDAVIEGVVFPDVRKLQWTSSDGLEIEGLLLTPSGADGPLPMLTLVHGGPSWCWGGYFSDSEPSSVLLASAGYAVFLPNPRGSNGRGHAFAQAVIDDPGGRDLEDIMTGVDMCIAEGIADPDKLGISGLSYGGYMTAWAVTQTNRFKAGVAYSIISNWTSFHLTSDIAAYDEFAIGGAWTDTAGPYAAWSPVLHAHKCETPTLMIQGALDRCTPVGQAEELFAAFVEAGVETELVIYPREGHCPMERAHARDAMQRTQDWFDRYLRPGD